MSMEDPKDPGSVTGPETPASPPPAPPPVATESEIERVGEGLELEKPRRRWSWKRRILVYGGGIVALGLLGFLGAWSVIWYYSDDPSLPAFHGLQDYRPPLVTDVYSGSNQLIGEFYNERRRLVPYDRIPKKLVQAFIATEDTRFFDHPGIDPIGIAKALLDKLLHGGKLRGASTLTQQTAKAILASRWGFEKATARNLHRKIIEMILAFRLEKIFTKEQILEIYLNHVYLGHHAYGVQSAAENYFRKNVWDLSLGEMALLAGLPQAPSAYSPFTNPVAAKKRRAHVLERMYHEGMITEGERDAANAEPVHAYPVADVFHDTAPFFTEHVRRRLVDRYGDDRVLNDGLQVYTTVDLEKQRYAQETMIQGLREDDKRQGYSGPLYHVPHDQWTKFAHTYETKVLKGRPLKVGKFYVALVTRVTANQANVEVGRTKGVLPLVGMRWAHAPNPELYYPKAFIDDCRKALKRGDAILVRRVTKDSYPTDDPLDLKQVPDDGTPLFSLEQEPELQGALVSLDPNSGYVVAMMGGLDFDLSEYNRAFQACRQPGSAFKPLYYSAAIANLNWTASTIIVDSPIVFDDPSTQLRWKPDNYENDFKGDVTMRTALVNSMNVPSVKVLQAVGIDKAIAWAHKLGITTDIKKNLSIALGSSCVTLYDLTKVYALFDRYGRRVSPTFIRRVVDRDGNTLEDRTVYFDPWAGLQERIGAGYARLFERPQQVIPETAAFLTVQLLRQVVLHGTGARAQRLGKPAAGKTGTTNDSFDAWFMGFTHDLVTGVWIGYDTYEHPMGRYETGSRAALPIWLAYMQKALADRDQGDFDPPADIADKIVTVDVDAETGKLANPKLNRDHVKMDFLKGTEPTEMQGDTKVTGTGSSDFFMHDSGM
jgi:penicillin-binding protein 1A